MLCFVDFDVLSEVIDEQKLPKAEITPPSAVSDLLMYIVSC